MPENNKRNLLWFEAASMKALYLSMEDWQATHRKRFASICVHQDGDAFCCIAVTNPTEVMIVDGYHHGGVDVTHNALKIYSDD